LTTISDSLCTKKYNTNDFCCHPAIKINEIMGTFNNNCDIVTRMSLFHIQTLDSKNVEFFNAFYKKLLKTSDFFRKNWINFIVESSSSVVDNDKRGWFDTDVKDWYIY
jgi:hypothetical protein